MTNLLVAGIGCHSRAHLVDAQRQTWVPSLTFDHRFFYGEQANIYTRRTVEADETELAVGDDYFNLADKVQMAVRWAIVHEYRAMFLVDDDTYVNDANFFKAVLDWDACDYVGRQRPDSPYLSGAAYYLSGRAMGVLAEVTKPSLVKRDFGMPAFPYVEGWIHHVLRLSGIESKADKRIKFSNVAAAKKVDVEPIDADTVADFEWAGLDMFARHNYQRDEKVMPSLEWRLQNLEARKQTSLADKIF